MTIRKKNRYEEIIKARKILNLPEQATMREIKEQYKNLVRQWHPDKNNHQTEKCHEMTQSINTAYQVILSYCNAYKFSFTREEVMKYASPEEQWMERFGDDPIWG